jgi:hypothetical protein
VKESKREECVPERRHTILMSESMEMEDTETQRMKRDRIKLNE